MNQSGQAVFAMFNWSSGQWVGTFLWDAKTEQTTAVALADMPATGDLVFEQAGEARPAINNVGEIALPAVVKNGAGKVLGVGLFFRDRDGKLQAAALPGQPGPDSVPIYIGAGFPTLASINDAGRIAFLARRQGQSQASAYVWEKGELTPVVKAGTQVAAGKIVEVAGAWVNNQNRTVLVDVILDTPARGLHALYRWDGSELHPVAVPGQAMPGGGQFATMPWLSMSFANDRGQHAFYARVTEGSQSFLAAYLMDADGTLSSVLKTGDVTDLGRILRVGEGVGIGVGLNNQGQVALPVRTEDGRFHLTLLTPSAPAPAAGN
jgi:hypothetical protein